MCRRYVLYDARNLLVHTLLLGGPRKISTIVVALAIPVCRPPPPSLPSGSGDTSVSPNLVGDARQPQTSSLKVAGSPQSTCDPCSGDTRVSPNLVGDALRWRTRSLKVAGSPRSTCDP